jgi:hypothetical protein
MKSKLISDEIRVGTTKNTMEHDEKVYVIPRAFT